MNQKIPISIPFNRPAVVGKELYYISQTILYGHAAGDGEFTRRCSGWLEQRICCYKALLTHSCANVFRMSPSHSG